MQKFLGLDKKWWQSYLFGLILFILFTIYNGINEHTVNIFVINKSLAGLATVLAGLSMMLASLGYLFKIGQKYLSYRMNIGVTAFLVACIHVGIASYFYFFASDPPRPNFDVWYVWKLALGFSISNVIAFTFGVMAIVLFAFMSLITYNYFLLKFGGVVWRKLLRYCGFTALVLVLLHFLIKNLDIWLHPAYWDYLPPLNLFIWIFGVTVLVLRFVMWLKLNKKP